MEPDVPDWSWKCGYNVFVKCLWIPQLEPELEAVVVYIYFLYIFVYAVYAAVLPSGMSGGLSA